MTKGNARTRHRESAPSGSHRVKPVSVSTLHHYLMRTVEAYSHSLLVDTVNPFREVSPQQTQRESQNLRSIYLSSINHEPSILTMRRDGQKRKIIRKMCI